MEVTVQEAKAHLSRLLRRVEDGETVIIRRGKHPVAMLGPAPRSAERRNIWGDVEGELTSEFDEPLEDLAPYQA